MNEIIYIPKEITVRELALLLDVSPGAVVSAFFLRGVMVKINSTIEFNTAIKIADRFSVTFGLEM